MTDLRTAAQQALGRAKWINDEQAIVSYEDMMNLRAALEQQEEGRMQFSVQETVCAQCGSTNGAHSHGCPVARTALEQPEQEPATSKDSLQVGQEEPEGGWQSAPSPQVTQRIADMPMSEYRRGVNDGFKLGLREGRIKAEDEIRGQQKEQEQPVRDMLISAAAMAVVAERKGAYQGASWVADAVLAQEQEHAPAAWIHTDSNNSRVRYLEWTKDRTGYRGDWIKTPLYTHPPRREWVGLKDEEIDSVTPYCHNEFDLAEFKDFARAIEAALKEKNHD